jgi:hypothetical protein
MQIGQKTHPWNHLKVSFIGLEAEIFFIEYGFEGYQKITYLMQIKKNLLTLQNAPKKIIG